MAVMAQVFKTLHELLLSVFGQLSAPPLNPEKRAAEESKEKEEFEVEIPVSSGKMTFGAEERRTETIFRLALSEEAIAAGLLEKARAWADAAEQEIRAKFPKLEKRVKIAVIKIHHNGHILPDHYILTIDARKQ